MFGQTAQKDRGNFLKERMTENGFTGRLQSRKKRGEQTKAKNMMKSLPFLDEGKIM